MHTKAPRDKIWQTNIHNVTDINCWRPQVIITRQHCTQHKPVGI